ncbi:glycerate kinase type-2 family protein [Wenyingzhuangia sp. IMCC45533]
MYKEQLQKIYYKALNKVKASALIKDNVSVNDEIVTIVDNDYVITGNSKLYVFGVGKAALAMAKECELILGNKINGGVVVSSSKGSLTYLEHYTSTHPLVSDRSIEAADKLINGLKELSENDVFIFLLSGGASAMIEKPISGLSLNDFTKISNSLLISGIDIKALNTVRKSISQIKGGKLANLVKAKGEVLVLSDVIGDDLSTIGSAPMHNYKFDHHVIGNNTIALETAKGYILPKVDATEIITTDLECSSEEALEKIYADIKAYDTKYDSFCLLYGGETTTVVKGEDGYGGRNQELALRLLLTDCVNENISILCAGSDGIDGRSDATGAFVDMVIYEKIREQKLNPQAYLDNSDSNTFFRTLDYDFVTGITGTNVMDFIIILKLKK